MKGHTYVDPAFKWLWKSSFQPKHQVLFWLQLKDRLNTRGILRRHMTLDSYVCEFCILQREETLIHLFIRCNFANAYWASIGLILPTNLLMLSLIRVLERKLDIPFYMDIVILICWSICTTRNEWIFSKIDPTNSLKGSRWCYIELNRAMSTVGNNGFKPIFDRFFFLLLCNKPFIY